MDVHGRRSSARCGWVPPCHERTRCLRGKMHLCAYPCRIPPLVITGRPV
ncbi:hypothetical protein OCGS_0213 [Oceaniovalibus guishaninsula JLT2003]|uniref:Uncharacterized protein n=1 Tax=Oceaniovalibus guishaninsula JLT2003 TaxID=1231392 RepID=K2GSS5_9RHOB|nr:hypothetical protein OCGS_0213 [Oceaniovalibus guishaninsula JLT2003]